MWLKYVLFLASHIGRHSLNWKDQNFYSCSVYVNDKSILVQKYCPCRSPIQENNLLCSLHLPELPKQKTNWHLTARTPQTSVKKRPEWLHRKGKGNIWYQLKKFKSIIQFYLLQTSRVICKSSSRYPQSTHPCMREWRSLSSTGHIEIHISPTQGKGKSGKNLFSVNELK